MFIWISLIHEHTYIKTYFLIYLFIKKYNKFEKRKRFLKNATFKKF